MMLSSVVVVDLGALAIYRCIRSCPRLDGGGGDDIEILAHGLKSRPREE